MTPKFSIQDLDGYVYVNSQGQLVVESVVRVGFIGDYDLMMSCVEDNIYYDDETDIEKIDWNGAEKDYACAVRMKEEKP